MSDNLGKDVGQPNKLIEKKERARKLLITAEQTATAKQAALVEVQRAQREFSTEIFLSELEKIKNSSRKSEAARNLSKMKSSEFENATNKPGLKNSRTTPGVMESYPDPGPALSGRAIQTRSSGDFTCAI